MPHDLVIRHGTVIDGTGAPGRRADVAVDGERITAIGDLAGRAAAREIDATGLTVTPGWVDLHAHLDAQVGWDPLVTSSSWHGVTTVVTGNCGVTFAPVLGLVDRGTLAVGAYADLNVLDPDRLCVGYPTYVHDSPNGKGRLCVKAEGYAATLVNGRIVTEHGRHSGLRPGRVLRRFVRR